jgi:hypothetical protein
LLDLDSSEEAKYSLLFGTKGIYYCNPKKAAQRGPGAVAYSEFHGRTFVNHGHQVYLGKKQFPFPGGLLTKAIASLNQVELGQEQFLCPEPEWIESYVDGCETIVTLLNLVKQGHLTGSGSAEGKAS